MVLMPKSCFLKLPPNAIHEIREVYNLDNPDRLEEAIIILEEWIQKQNHILKKDFDRGYLESTIISSKGSIEKAKSKIDQLCTVKTLLPHFFNICNVKTELSELFDVAWMLPLPKVTDDYYRVILTKVYNKPFTPKSYLQCFQYAVVMCEYLSAHDYVNGLIFIDDYQEANLMDMTINANVVELQQFMSIVTNGFGARLKSMHMLTQSTLIDVFVKIVKPILSQKLASRLHVHKTSEQLHEMVPKDILPVDYGGTERPLSELWEMWMDEFTSPESIKYIKMMNKASTDEKLRRSDKFNEDYMGMPGSFRHLNVD